MAEDQDKEFEVTELDDKEMEGVAGGTNNCNCTNNCRQYDLPTETGTVT